MASKKPGKRVHSGTDDVDVYTSRLYELNMQAQDAVKEFALHDIDDIPGLEKKRIIMHDAFTELYDEIADFSEEIKGEEFDISYIRERITHAEGDTKEQLENALKELIAKAQETLADVWMAKVLAWLHQAAAAKGPLIESEHPDKLKSASAHLAEVFTMLEKPFSAVPSKADGTEKLRRVALGDKAYSLMSEGREEDDKELAGILGNNKTAEAEFYDEFLNELIGKESTFRQAFNPFDELVWRDILSSFIFEEATDLYNEALPYFMKNKKANKQKISMIMSWKQNTAGLSEVYLAMTYNDIADSQMRAGNLEDASKLYQVSSDHFGRAEKCFRKELQLLENAVQSESDMKHKKAQSLFCRAENSVQTLSELIRMNNRDESITVLKEIFKDLKRAEKLAKTRELTAAIQADLTTFSFVEDLLKKKKKTDALDGVAEQIDFAKQIRKTSLIQSVSKALDEARAHMTEEPVESLEAIKEGLDTLGILLSLDLEDAEVGDLRNRTIAILNNVKYVIQFQLSSKLQTGVKFILSRILENLHAMESASYYKVIGERESAEELTDLGRLALATAFASEAQVYSKQAEQWAFRSQMERANYFSSMADELAQLEADDDSADNTIEAHETTIGRIKQTLAAFEAAANELASVKGVEIRSKNNVEAQVQQLEAVVLKFKGDLSRIEGAKSDFMAEVEFKKGADSKAKIHYSDASDHLREAAGNYAVAAQVFQQSGDGQAAQSVENRRQMADGLARVVWENRQRLDRDQDPVPKRDQELAALYMGGGG